MKKRIIGLDLARALAVIGMIIVNFKVVFGDKGSATIKFLVGLFDGKAAATFVVLAGVGLALMSNSAIRSNDLSKLKKVRQRIFKRAVFLFIIGLSYIAIWPADILHFYGIYMAITLVLLNASNRAIIGVAAGLVAAFPVLMFLWNYDTGWNFDTLNYSGFWTVKGFLRNLFYNGFHPVLPWAAFMLFGFWFGRQDLYNTRFVKKSLWVSIVVFTGVQLLSNGLIKFLSSGNADEALELSQILGTNPMPPLPLYMINGVAIAIAVISTCILIARRFESNFIVKSLVKTGQLALTFYVAHVIVGMGLVEALSPQKMGQSTIVFSLVYALAFSLICVLFALIWLKFKKSGPLEWLMRKITD